MDKMNIFYRFYSDYISTFPGSILIIVTILLIILIKSVNFKYLFAPGPWGIPVLGFYPFLRKKDHHIHLMEMAKKYGDAYLITMLGKRYLHLSSSKVAREAFVTKAECFDGRPQEFSFFQYVFKNGVFYTNGEPWHVLRKFFTQAMRELGIGAKEQFKDPLSIAIKNTLKAFEGNKGKPINITELFYTECTEVIKQMILGDISADLTVELNNSYLACMPAPTMAHLFVGNVARYLVLNRVPGYKEMFEGKKKIVALLKKILEEHKINFDPEYPRDFIDIYLRERNIRKDKKSPEAVHFTDEALIATLIQVYGDGGSSVGSIVAVFLKYVAQRPETQEELYEEIKREIGTEKEPTYEDKIKLPLMNSVIKEIERIFATMMATFSALQASCDTTVSGVYVPKGTIAMVNHYGIHYDPRLYKDPESFNPRRFLTDEETKRPKEDLPVLFGIGRRSCPGESLFLTELFVFLTAILQKFTMKLAEENGSNEEVGFDTNCTIIATPR